MHQRILALTLAAIVAGASACSSGSNGYGGGTGPGGGPLGGASATIVASGTGGSNNGYGNNGGGQFYFSPVPDTVAVGSTVSFQFQDVLHTVTFDAAPSAVADIPATANAIAVRMFAAGTYTYHCSIHPYMHGTIVAR
jgi:plastocyanin